MREAFALGRKRLSRLRVDFRLMTKTRGLSLVLGARYSKILDGTIRINNTLNE